MKETNAVRKRSRAGAPALWQLLLAVGLWGAAAAHADDHLPVPWNGMDIGDPVPAGAASMDNGSLTVTAGGSGLSGTSDQFHFVFQAVSGDFALIARVTPPSGADRSAGAGLMVRDALAAASNFAAVVQTPGQGVLSQYRTAYSPTVGADTVPASGPVWVRLVKRGTTVDAFQASDAGSVPGAWKKVGGDQPIGSGMIYAGLCLSSHSPGTGCRATFDHVSLAIGPQPALDNGTYTIVPVSAPAMALSAADGKVRLAAPGQRWTFTGKGGDLYAIQTAQDGSLALAVAGGGTESGTGIVLQADQGRPSERWSVVPNGNGTYGLVPQCAPGSGLDDFGGNTTAAAHIDIWQRWDSDPHTQWTITSAP